MSADDDVSSLCSSEDNAIKIEDLIENEPMYHVLAEFLLTPENKNIAHVLDNICKELKELRLAISSLNKVSDSPSPETA